MSRPQAGLSAAPHKIKNKDLEQYNPRSEPVRRQGLEPPNPRIKSPLLRNSTPAFYQHLCISTLARCPQPAEAEYRPLAACTA